jgi:hypothetical protein
LDEEMALQTEQRDRSAAPHVLHPDLSQRVVASWDTSESMEIAGADDMDGKPGG